MSGRIGAWTTTVRCVNKDCSDNGVDRLISLPHVGDGVFLSPTTTSIVGLPALNLLCGTCKKAMFIEAESGEAK